MLVMSDTKGLGAEAVPGWIVLAMKQAIASNVEQEAEKIDEMLRQRFHPAQARQRRETVGTELA
jgi:hypothetical protein